MFPAYSGAVLTSKTEEKSDSASAPDWLSNPSFKSQDAVILQKIQAERFATNEQSEYNKEQVTDRQEGESIRKRHHESSESSDLESSDTERWQRHKEKKKKKKHKYKKKYHKKRDRSRSPHGKKYHERERDHMPVSSIESGSSKKIFIEEMCDLKPEHAYRFDKQPDKENLMYDTLYKLHIAKHYSIRGKCLGQPDDVVIVWNEKKHKKQDGGNNNRFFDKENRKLLKREDSPVIDLSKPKLHKNLDTTKFSENANVKTLSYLPCEVSEVEDLVDQKLYNPLGVYDKGTAAWTQGKGLTSAKGLTSEGDKDNKETVKLKETDEQCLQRRIGEYNKHLREYPHDIGKWLEFVKFQDETVSSEFGYSGLQKEEERRKKREVLVLEKKMAILEKAIQENPKSIELRIFQLEICRGIWEHSKLHSEWKQLLFLHPNNPELWQNYLLFVQSQLSGFTVGKVVTAYHKCFLTLNGFLEGTTKSHPLLPNTETYMFEIFCQYCHFLQQCGHLEKAIASLQASIEFNLFCPETLSSATFKDKTTIFEAFWDSNVPRFGENEAHGWAAFVEKKEIMCSAPIKPTGDENEIEDTIVNQKLGRQQTWLKMEQTRESRHMLPWKPDLDKEETEEDCEDPDRLVLFDDITSCLFQISSGKLKLSLVICLLQLLGVNNNHDDLTLMKSKIGNVLYLNFSSKIFSARKDSEVYGTIHSGIEYNEEIYNLFLKNIFSQTLKAVSGANYVAISQLWLKFEISKLKLKNRGDKKQWKSACKEVKKLAKSLLKDSENRNSLILWDAYAKFEWLLGNRDEARNVYDTAITMAAQAGLKSNNLREQSDAVCLYRSYAELELGLSVPNINGSELETGEDLTSSAKDRALHILTFLGEKEHYTPKINSDAGPLSTQILRARKAYQSTIENLKKIELENGVDVQDEMAPSSSLLSNKSCFVQWVICYALYQYLTTNLQTAVIIFEQALEKLKSNEQFVKTDCEYDHDAGYAENGYEQLLNAYIKFLHFHVTTAKCSLSVLRVPLQRALQEFPDSVNLTNEYIDLELKSHISGRLRRYFNNVAQKRLSESVVPWLMAVHAELKRQHKLKQEQTIEADQAEEAATTETGLTHRLRSIFERAVEKPVVKHCVLLWRVYLYFEKQQGDLQRAYGVFYRAVQQCPWAKSLYVDGVTYFPEKLQEILDLMVECEIRVRAPLEEVDLMLGYQEKVENMEQEFEQTTE